MFSHERWSDLIFVSEDLFGWRIYRRFSAARLSRVVLQNQRMQVIKKMCLLTLNMLNADVITVYDLANTALKNSRKGIALASFAWARLRPFKIAKQRGFFSKMVFEQICRIFSFNTNKFSAFSWLLRSQHYSSRKHWTYCNWWPIQHNEKLRNNIDSLQEVCPISWILTILRWPCQQLCKCADDQK